MKNNEILEDMERETLSTWVKTMLTIYPTLPNIIKVIDSIVELRATNLTSAYTSSGQLKYSSYDQVDRVIKMMERKSKMLRIHDFVCDLIKPLKKEELRFLKLRFFTRMRIEKLVEVTGISTRSVYRKAHHIISKLTSALSVRGITSCDIEDMVKGEHWIYAQYDKHASEKKTNFLKGRNFTGRMVEDKNMKELVC